MTIWSNPIALPVSAGSTGSWDVGGIATITSGIAVACWYDDGEGGSRFAAVRHTNSGPEVGPSFSTERLISELVSGRDGEVWALDDYQKLWQITIEPQTLELTVIQRWSVPAWYVGYGGLLEAWPEQDALVVAHNNAYEPATTEDNYHVFLIHMDTGQVLAHAESPRLEPANSANTNHTFTMGIALNRESGRLLLMGDVDTGTYYRSGMWAANIDPTSGFAAWEYLGAVPLAPGYINYDGYRWCAAVGVPEGWNVLYMSYRADDVRLLRIELDGSLIEGDMPSTYASTYWSDNFPKVYDVTYDAEAGRTLAAYMDWYEGLEFLSGDPVTLEFTQEPMPKSFDSDGDRIANYVTMTQVAAVGQERYIYRGSCTAILKPRGPGLTDSFGAMVWAGGEGVALSAGGQHGSTGRNFRRVR